MEALLGLVEQRIVAGLDVGVEKFKGLALTVHRQHAEGVGVLADEVVEPHLVVAAPEVDGVVHVGQVDRVLVDVAVEDRLDCVGVLVEGAELCAEAAHVGSYPRGVADAHDVAEVVDPQVDRNAVRPHKVNVLVAVVHRAVGLSRCQQEQPEDSSQQEQAEDAGEDADLTGLAELLDRVQFRLLDEDVGGGVEQFVVLLLPHGLGLPASSVGGGACQFGEGGDAALGELIAEASLLLDLIEALVLHLHLLLLVLLQQADILHLCVEVGGDLVVLDHRHQAAVLGVGLGEPVVEGVLVGGVALLCPLLELLGVLFGDVGGQDDREGHVDELRWAVAHHALGELAGLGDEQLLLRVLGVEGEGVRVEQQPLLYEGAQGVAGRVVVVVVLENALLGGVDPEELGDLGGGLLVLEEEGVVDEDVEPLAVVVEVVLHQLPLLVDAVPQSTVGLQLHLQLPQVHLLPLEGGPHSHVAVDVLLNLFRQLPVALLRCHHRLHLHLPVAQRPRHQIHPPSEAGLQLVQLDAVEQSQFDRPQGLEVEVDGLGVAELDEVEVEVGQHEGGVLGVGGQQSLEEALDEVLEAGLLVELGVGGVEFLEGEGVVEHLLPDGAVDAAADERVLVVDALEVAVVLQVLLLGVEQPLHPQVVALQSGPVHLHRPQLPPPREHVQRYQAHPPAQEEGGDVVDAQTVLAEVRLHQGDHHCEVEAEHPQEGVAVDGVHEEPVAVEAEPEQQQGSLDHHRYDQALL